MQQDPSSSRAPMRCARKHDEVRSVRRALGPCRATPIGRPAASAGCSTAGSSGWRCAGCWLPILDSSAPWAVLHPRVREKAPPKKVGDLPLATRRAFGAGTGGELVAQAPQLRNPRLVHVRDLEQAKVQLLGAAGPRTGAAMPSCSSRPERLFPGGSESRRVDRRRPSQALGRAFPADVPRPADAAQARRRRRLPPTRPRRGDARADYGGDANDDRAPSTRPEVPIEITEIGWSARTPPEERQRAIDIARVASGASHLVLPRRALLPHTPGPRPSAAGLRRLVGSSTPTRRPSPRARRTSGHRGCRCRALPQEPRSCG